MFISIFVIYLKYIIALTNLGKNQHFANKQKLDILLFDFKAKCNIVRT